MQHLTGQEVERGAAGGEGPQRVFLGVGNRRQVLADLGQASLARMVLAVEQDKAAAPVGKGRHGRFGVTALPGRLTELVEQARRGRCGGGGLRRCWGIAVAIHGSPPGRFHEP